MPQKHAGNRILPQSIFIKENVNWYYLTDLPVCPLLYLTEFSFIIADNQPKFEEGGTVMLHRASHFWRGGEDTRGHMVFSQSILLQRRLQMEINWNNLLKPAVTFSQLSKQTLHLYQYQLVRVSHSSRRAVFLWLGIYLLSLFLSHGLFYPSEVLIFLSGLYQFPFLIAFPFNSTSPVNIS